MKLTEKQQEQTLGLVFDALTKSKYEREQLENLNDELEQRIITVMDDNVSLQETVLLCKTILRSVAVEQNLMLKIVTGTHDAMLPTDLLQNHVDKMDLMLSNDRLDINYESYEDYNDDDEKELEETE